MADLTILQKITKLIRYYILVSSSAAGSGHPTSSLSATELMTALLFGQPRFAGGKAGGNFHFDLDNAVNPTNDRLIFSKGHASPLYYALWAAAGRLTEDELKTFRKFGSPLEGHPTLRFPYAEAATGSLGQGLSIGVGMAMNAKYLDKLDYKTFVLLGDSEMAEGSVWEAIQIAAHYKLDNLVGVLDVNRLGQRGETMYGHRLEEYEKRIAAFGWDAIVIDGHNMDEILAAYAKALADQNNKPKMIIAKTLKGKGVSFIEDKDNWHGKALSADELKKALEELGEIDKTIRGEISRPEIPNKTQDPNAQTYNLPLTTYDMDKPVATRKAYGNALVNLAEAFPNIVALDGEVSNSTMAEIFQKSYPHRFFEMYIAEQNMAGVALGLSRRGKIPFVSTFAAFFTRAFDQIRMSQYSGANIKFVGSHAGISIGEDGPSQMGLEDLAMFRSVMDSVVLYPSDAVSTEKLVAASAKHKGIVYIRTTRKDTPIIYNNEDNFEIGGSKILKSSDSDAATVVAAGITLHEALSAYETLQKDGINIRVIDLYSVKPLDEVTLQKATLDTKIIITVEDHYPAGGIGEAVSAAIAAMPNVKVQISNLAVRKMPMSGRPDELLADQEIDRSAIIRKVREFLKG